MSTSSHRPVIAAAIARSKFAPGPMSAWLLALAAGLPGPLWACATCGCTVNADAVMGYSTASGWRLNIEYDYIDQDQLRSGTGTASPAEVVNNPSDPALGGGEIENQTLNRYLRIGLSYQPDANWNFGVSVPYILRDHSTFGQQ